jgi:NAD(P)-dependent dehydrogenase (short-subunit alcohol dehydrogenase family)
LPLASSRSFFINALPACGNLRFQAAQPEEIAPAFVFLAAPSCSSYITGEILPIIGGYSGE